MTDEKFKDRVVEILTDIAISLQEISDMAGAVPNTRANNQQRRVMRVPAVLAATGWAKPTLYAKIAAGKFPKGTKLDPDARAVVWFEDEVSRWQQSRCA